MAETARHIPVIDFHMHTARVECAPDSFDQFYRAQHLDKPDFEAFVEEFAQPERVEQMLDECGIDYANILAEVAPITSGTARNEYVAELCAGHPRLIPVASINPFMTAQPGKELTRLVTHYGFRALKMYPTYQWFAPNDHKLYPLYSAAQDLGIPIMFHTGSSVFAGARLKYGDPLLLDDVAVDFPSLNLLLSHAGRPFWYDRAAFLARLHQNVYLDLAGLPPKNLLKYMPELGRITDKCVYGSDWPGVSTIKENTEAFRNLPFSEQQKAMILGGTAARLLRIDY